MKKVKVLKVNEMKNTQRNWKEKKKERLSR